MKTRLICPALRPAVAGLARRCPLATLPLLGGTPLDAQLSALYADGVREVEILVADRPEIIRAHVGSGEAWGLRINVTPMTKESRIPDTTILDDEGSECAAAFSSYRAWFETVRKVFPGAIARRAGMREIAPGVCVHSRADISPEATLTAPCWVGANTRVGPECLIGPGAYIEDNCCIEGGANIEDSWVGPGTYVGPFTDVLDSLAWGRWLCKWTTGATTDVHDSFLLGEIPVEARQRGRYFARSLAAVAILLTLFVPVIGALLSAFRRRPVWVKRDAILPDGSVMKYGELPGYSGLLRRWPRLFLIATAEFAWVGNPPLTPNEAGALLSEHERLWYAFRPGLISLADVHGIPDSRDDAAVAHASYFVACHSFAGKLRVVRLVILRALGCPPATYLPEKSKTNEDILSGTHTSRN